MSMVMSLPSNSISSFSCLSSHPLLAGIRYRFSPVEISTSKHGCMWFYSANQGMQSTIIWRGVRRSKIYAVMEENLPDNVLPGALPPSTPSFFIWMTCILGSMVSLTLTLSKIKDKVEKVEEEVKDAVEIVEDVAEGMEKVSSDIGDKIPKDGILNDAVSWVEKASNVVGDAAKQVLDFFHKVDEIKEEVEKDLEKVEKDLEKLSEHQQNDGEREEQESLGGKEKKGEEIRGKKEKDEK
ncbi:hypothetical protein AAC387_Pa11g1367 [Persea americana]|eukprot:TRINITY_DN82772_c0_g1_i1.p1 TRINITY_DN82772_c0_g1~~TRINITY_DN82772_c0_g1_i1.p1  ORF type:complete len:239 (-),score=58.54 TRINITY_DN82772_c0_g1_i1:144-860(-)